MRNGFRVGCAAALIMPLLLTACEHKVPASRNTIADAQPTLKSRLDEILHRRDDGTLKYTARVIELDTGRELYAVMPDEPFMPASNMKLSVSAAALDTFGPDKTFDTILATRGEDLWLIGTGDPAAGDPSIEKKCGRLPTSVLDDWATALLNRGVTQIKGNLYFDDGAFDDSRYNAHWSKGYIGDWYAAPVSGLNLNDDCIDITLYPSADGKPVAYTIMPPVTNVKIVNECVTGEGKEKPTIDRDPDSNTYTISGACTRPTTLPSKSVVDSGAFFADALRTRLALRGIAIAGETKRGKRPADAQVLATHETAMTDVMWRINKSSQNLFADAMFKLMGGGTWQGGSGAVHAFLKKAGINDSQFKAFDGSGLARDDRLTARLQTDLLAYMARHKYADAYRASMSQAGVDGTIRNRMHDLKGRVFAKTGYIGGVRALSGYVQQSDGKWLAFSIIYNGFKGSERPFEVLQDEAVRVLADLPNIGPAPRPRPRRVTSAPTTTSADE